MCGDKSWLAWMWMLPEKGSLYKTSKVWNSTTWPMYLHVTCSAIHFTCFSHVGSTSRFGVNVRFVTNHQTSIGFQDMHEWACCAVSWSVMTSFTHLLPDTARKRYGPFNFSKLSGIGWCVCPDCLGCLLYLCPAGSPNLMHWFVGCYTEMCLLVLWLW